VTVAVTITADGTLLPSTLVFKRKPDGRIAKKEFSTYPKTHFYKCQEAAWMDEEVMIAWVKLWRVSPIYGRISINKKASCLL